jgi:hypothetical protein
VIVQAKTGVGFSEAAIDRLISITEDLLDLSHSLTAFTAVYNNAVRAGIATFRKVYTSLAARFPKLRITFAYASRGLEVHPNVTR